MIKILSFKTRRPDLDFHAFRSHYEGEHVPLGLSFVAHFGWRRYVRNYVVAAVQGDVDFDCLTEFWVGSRADQERTRAFVASPEFELLDRDDRRFLDVTRRLSFEVEEHELVDPRPLAQAERLTMLIEGRDDADAVWRAAQAFAARHRADCRRISLDLRRPAPPSGSEGGIQALLSVWSETPEALVWPRFSAPAPILRLASVESPPALLCGTSSAPLEGVAPRGVRP